MEDYTCETSKISEGNYFDYIYLIYSIRDGRKNETSRLTNELSSFGSNTNEVLDYLTKHLGDCGSCAEFFNGITEAIGIIKDLKEIKRKAKLPLFSGLEKAFDDEDRPTSS